MERQKTIVFIICVLFFSMTNKSYADHLRKVNYNHKIKNKSIAASVKRLINQINNNPSDVFSIVQASRFYKVPIDILLAHWRMESFFHLSGDPGKNSALANIRYRQNPKVEPRRWRRFIQNEKDLWAICAHCGYSNKKCRRIKGSSTGAIGPMQFQPSTWMFVRIDGNKDGRACPIELPDALAGAAFFLLRKYKRYGSWDKAMLRYAGGNYPRNRAYVRRSRLMRYYFCHIIRYAAGKNLKCSIGPLKPSP